MMRNITLVFKSIIVLALVAGCSANRLPDYSPLPAHQYSNTRTHKNLTVAIYPMMDGAEVEKYFGTNLLQENILPIFIVIDNQDKHANYFTRKEDVVLLKSKDQGVNTKNFSEDARADMKTTSEVVGGGMIVGGMIVGGILAGASMRSHVAEISRNFSIKEFQQAFLSPGSSASGFVYFKIPDIASYNKPLRLQVSALDTVGKIKLAFIHTFSLQSAKMAGELPSDLDGY